MRTIPGALQTHILGDVTTLAVCWRVTRTDGVLILGTEHDRDLTIAAGDYSGTYLARAGITGSNVRSSSDMSVDNLEVEGAVNSGDLNLVDLSAADIEAGLFDDVSVVLFLVNWQAPDDGQVVLRTGNIGAITRTAEGQYRTELRGLAQRLTQNFVRTYGPSCDAELGDVRCGVGLPALTITGAVTAVESNRAFSTSLAIESPMTDDDFFDGGLVRWTSGQNTGFRMELKRAAAAEGGGPATETLLTGTSWTCPAGVTSVTVECWGGGGGGGGNTSNTECGGGGGGGGAYAKKTVAVTPGNSYAYAIGQGGTGVAASDGNPGGDTGWNSNEVMAKGGSGGGRSLFNGFTQVGGTGGDGGLASASVGDVKYDGGWGENGRTHSTGTGGWGGSSAGTASDGHANGAAASWTTVTYPTGSTPAGGGHGGNGAPTQTSNGVAPVAGQYGGGGGGSGEGTTRLGGTGANGKIVLSYVVEVGFDIDLYLPMPLDIEVGDTFELSPACDKSAAMCKGRFGNLVNFRGHGAWVPGTSEMMVFGGQTAARKPTSPEFLQWPRPEEP